MYWNFVLANFYGSLNFVTILYLIINYLYLNLCEYCGRFVMKSKVNFITFKPFVFVPDGINRDGIILHCGF